MARRSTRNAQPDADAIDVASFGAEVTGQPASTLELTEQAAPVAPVVTRGVPKPPTPGLKVQLKQRSTGRIIAMSVDKALAVRLAAANPNLEII